MTEHNQKLVADLRSEATIFPMGCMHELLLQAAASIESLSNDSHLINASNKLLNDKCERLMNRGDDKTIKTLNEAVADLKEHLNAATKRGNDLQTLHDNLARQVSDIVAEKIAVKKELDLAVATGTRLAEAVFSQAKILCKLADRI